MRSMVCDPHICYKRITRALNIHQTEVKISWYSTISSNHFRRQTLRDRRICNPVH
ncbi:hypothetical protein BDV93DRAFT_247929 [Ceratobasidium sp. AG-I]|nr:hypothetical protein BDV93DRAFT_247929 [Ceratobasidium sp. AG-I]